MPRYQNVSTTSIKVDGVVIPPGEQRDLPRYVDDDNLRFISDTPAAEAILFERDHYGAPINVLRPGASANIHAISGEASQTVAFPTGTKVVRVVSDQKVRLLFTESGEATSSDVYLPADIVEYFSVGERYTNLAAVAVDTDAWVNVTRMV